MSSGHLSQVEFHPAPPVHRISMSYYGPDGLQVEVSFEATIWEMASAASMKMPRVLALLRGETQ